MVSTRDGRSIFGVKRIIGQMVRDDMDWRTVLLVIMRFEEASGSSEAYDTGSNDHDGSRRVKRRRHIICFVVGTPFAVLWTESQRLVHTGIEDPEEASRYSCQNW